MLPTAGAVVHHHHHHHHKPNFLLRSVKCHHLACLLATVFLQLFILLYLNRTSPPPPADDINCPHGRIYLYDDVPSMLNQDLLDNCNDIDPWSSRCLALSNSGFGPPATGLHTLVPSNLTAAWHWTDLYAAEVIFHDRMKNYRCLTSDQSVATAFYIPFYAGLAVGKYLWHNHTARDRDLHAARMLEWIQDQPPWRRSSGSDHFLMLGRLTWDFRRLTDDDSEWGTRFLYMPAMKKVLRLSVERSRWDDLEVSVPYPTTFHPRSGSDVHLWQTLIRTRTRSSLISFVGGARRKFRNDFRGVLMDYCSSESSCRLVDCSVAKCYDGAPAILEPFLDSDFCLQPKGDGFTRRSTFDCLLAGSIPVFFWRWSTEGQYEWHMPAEARSYSVFIEHGAVRNRSTVITEVVGRYSKEEVRKMRETIIELLPHLIYARSNADFHGDAFDFAMEGVLKRFQKQKVTLRLRSVPKLF